MAGCVSGGAPLPATLVAATLGVSRRQATQGKRLGEDAIVHAAAGGSMVAFGQPRDRLISGSSIIRASQSCGHPLCHAGLGNEIERKITSLPVPLSYSELNPQEDIAGLLL